MLYLLALALAVSYAILVVRNRLELLLKSSDDLTDISAGQGHSQSAALLEVEITRLALGDIQRRRQTNHLAQQSHQGTSSVDKSQMTAPNRGSSAARTGG